MSTLTDVARIATGFPDVAEGERHGHRTWTVRGKVFAWERPFSKADLKRFGEVPPPDGPVVAVRVDDLDEKEAVLAAHPGPLFTIPHFDGYAAVLVHLASVPRPLLREVLADGWLACAPADLAAAFLARRRRPTR